MGNIHRNRCGNGAVEYWLNAHNTQTTSEKIYPLIDTNLSIQARTPLKRMHPCTYEAWAALKKTSSVFASPSGNMLNEPDSLQGLLKL
jgi:hypothetical protein